MADFKELLKRPVEDAKRPPLLPAGPFYGVIKDFKFDESSKQKTPYVRFNVNLTGPGDGIDPDDLVDEDGKPVDLTRRTMRTDFYITEDALFRLREFLESLGIDIEKRSFSETIPETVGQEVLVIVGQETSQSNPENIFNTITRIGGVNAE